MMEIETPMLHLPLRRLKNLFSSSTLSIERDLQSVSSSILSLKSKTSSISHQDASKLLSDLVKRLESLKTKLEETNRLQQELADKFRARAENLSALSSAQFVNDDLAAKVWYKNQIDRLMIDHLLRNGEYELAKRYAKEAQLADFVDVDLFETKLKPVIETLKVGDMSEASKWLQQNQSRIKKMERSDEIKDTMNDLELEIATQNFFSLVQSGQNQQAIQYAQEKFLPFTTMGEKYASKVRHTMGMLVFLAQPNSQVYNQLASSNRYSHLISLFLSLWYSFYGLPNESLLNITLRSGLTALMTPNCLLSSSDITMNSDMNSNHINDSNHSVNPMQSDKQQEGKDKNSTKSNQSSLSEENMNFHLNHSSLNSGFNFYSRKLDCPCCSANLRFIASQLPLPSRPTSSIICPITHRLIDESNPAYALPDGTVVSKAAIAEMSRTSSPSKSRRSSPPTAGNSSNAQLSSVSSFSPSSVKSNPSELQGTSMMEGIQFTSNLDSQRSVSSPNVENSENNTLSQQSDVLTTSSNSNRQQTKSSVPSSSPLSGTASHGSNGNSNSAFITDPRTNQKYNVSSLRRVFIM